MASRPADAARLGKPVVATLRGLAMGILSIVLATGAIGWLYWLRQPTAHWPGPFLPDALPLDELPGHDSVPLIVFAVAMTVAGLLAGLGARLLRLDGFAIALAVGVGVGTWLYISSAISIFIVDQISLDSAFDKTRDLAQVYVAAGLFAASVVLVARRRSAEAWLTRIVPGCVGFAGLVSIVSGTLPLSSAERVAIGGLLTGPTLPLTRTIDVLVGVLLLLSARGLARRNRPAFVLSVIMLLVGLVTRIGDGFSVAGIVVSALVLLILIARRSDFSIRADPSPPRGVGIGFVRLFAVILGAFIYGVLALVIYRAASGLPVSVTGASGRTVELLFLGNPRWFNAAPNNFGAWFPWSLRAIVALGIIWATTTVFAPWSHRLDEADESRDLARQLVKRYGEDTLAPFALRADKALFFFPNDGSASNDSRTVFIAFRVVRGVALVSGDPIGAAEQVPAAVAAFRLLCAERGWRLAILGASERHLDAYREQGLRPLYHGDEAVIETATFTLEGGAMKSVRQAAQRLERKGYGIEIARGGDISVELRSELAALESSWLAGGKRKGFVMELDELFRLDGDDAVFVLGRNPEGALVGFLEIAVCPAISSLSLSSMPRSDESPNGMNAALIVAAIAWANENGFSALSLNFSPAARLFDANVPLRGVKRAARAILLVAKRVLHLQLDNLLVFNRHFLPRWSSRYVVAERYRHLPRVVIAAMAAERYLPFADFLRGRDWPAPDSVTLASRVSRR